MTTVPFGSWMAEQTANCEAPPPDGSTATRMLLVLAWYSKSEWRLMSPMRGRLKKASTRCEGKALCVPSDARPMLSRSNIAGSSARNGREASQFCAHTSSASGDQRGNTYAHLRGCP